MSSRKIDINTPQNVVIQYPLASLGERILAVIVDSVLLFLLLWALVAWANNNLQNSELFIIVFVAPIFVFYALINEILFKGQSVGKKAIGIKVLRLDGSQATAGDFLLRWAMRGIDVLYSLGTIGSILISSSPRSQRLGDRIANTTVIRVRQKTSIHIQDFQELKPLDEILFPEVKNFSEQDMLTLKQVIDRYRRFRNRGHSKALDMAFNKMCGLLGVEAKTDATTDQKKEAFLRRIIREYVELTRA